MNPKGPKTAAEWREEAKALILSAPESHPHLRELDCSDLDTLKSACEILEMDEDISSLIRDDAIAIREQIAAGDRKKLAETLKKAVEKWGQWCKDAFAIGSAYRAAGEVLQFLYVAESSLAHLEGRALPTAATVVGEERKAIAGNLQAEADHIRTEFTDTIRWVQGRLNELHEAEVATAIRLVARLQEELKDGTHVKNELEQSWPSLKHTMTELSESDSECNMDMHELGVRCDEQKTMAEEDLRQMESILSEYKEKWNAFNGRKEEMIEFLRGVKWRIENEPDSLLCHPREAEEALSMINPIIYNLETVSERTAGPIWRTLETAIENTGQRLAAFKSKTDQ